MIFFKQENNDDEFDAITVRKYDEKWSNEKTKHFTSAKL